MQFLQIRRLPAVAATVAAVLIAGAAPAIQVVHQKGRAFSVAAITVARGEKVVFVNDDTVPHNVFSQAPGNAFNLGSQLPGTSTPVSFDKPGIVAVMCAIHPRMHMVITVTE